MMMEISYFIGHGKANKSDWDFFHKKLGFISFHTKSPIIIEKMIFQGAELSNFA